MKPDRAAFISRFEDISAYDRATVGGKGASLGELIRAGIRVPPGVVVTTASFERFLAATDTDGEIRDSIQALDPADLDNITKVSARVRERILKSSLPTELRQGICNAYQRLCGDDLDVPVAIRSSATSEDSADASFAGLQDTLLWIRGEKSVIDAVRGCWSSLYSSESVSYRLRLGLKEQQLAMGVVIQTMVDSYCSGVMFTRSPTTGDRSVIALEGSWGLGSSIVSGDVTPDKYVVNKVTGEIVKRMISDKAVQHLPDPHGNGVIEQAVEEDRRTIPCLSDDEIAELADIGKHVERHYGCPQDIEWAISKNRQQIFLLQSRPETVWANRESKPVAAPKARAFDHVISLLSGKNK
jgi:pyruvate,water dikinase